MCFATMVTLTTLRTRFIYTGAANPVTRLYRHAHITRVVRKLGVALAMPPAGYRPSQEKGSPHMVAWSYGHGVEGVSSRGVRNQAGWHDPVVVFWDSS